MDAVFTLQKMSNVHRLAQLFKERDNKKTFGVNSGIVIKSEPELVIQIDGKHDFKQDEIMVLFEPMMDYLRECEIELEGEIEDTYSDNVEVPQQHKWTSSKSTYKLKGKGTIKLIDTLKPNDIVLCETIQDDTILVVYGKLKKIGE
jgi:hypothetical protein